MAAKPKIPAPANADETEARVAAWLAEFKVLGPAIVETMHPIAGLKLQRKTTVAWLEEFFKEGTDIHGKVKEAIKVYGLSEPPAEQPAEPAKTDTKTTAAAPGGKPASKPRRSRAAAAAKPPADAPKEQETAKVPVPA